LINRESIRKIWWNVAPVLIGLIVAVVGFSLPRVLVELDLASMFTAEVTTVDRRFVGHLSALQVFHKLQSGSPVNSLPADRIPLPLFKILEAASAQLHLQVMQGETYNH